MGEKEDKLGEIVSLLERVRALAKDVRADYSFVSEVDHMRNVALYNLDEERRNCAKGN